MGNSWQCIRHWYVVLYLGLQHYLFNCYHVGLLNESQTRFACSISVLLLISIATGRQDLPSAVAGSLCPDQIWVDLCIRHWLTSSSTSYGRSRLYDRYVTTQPWFRIAQSLTVSQYHIVAIRRTVYRLGVNISLYFKPEHSRLLLGSHQKILLHRTIPT